jgi:hypothetical protein
MEQFPDGAHVRLRSRVHGGYLHADEDGMGVSLRRWRRRTMNAAWTVHRILQDGSTSVLLHSAAYGRYLAASNDPAPPGHIGLRVDLGDYDQDVDPILWKVVGSGDAGYVLLRHVSNRLLRANGRYRLWLSGVSVDDVDNQSTMMHWKVETIPTSPNPPALARTPVSSPVPRPLLPCTLPQLLALVWAEQGSCNLQFRFVEPVLEAPALDVSLLASIFPRTAKWDYCFSAVLDQFCAKITNSLAQKIVSCSCRSNS